MLLEQPSILVTPREYEVEPDQMDALATAMSRAIPGQVIHCSFPVRIYHLIDGLWIESRDLPDVLVKAESGSLE